jgi:hypothetical protein
MATDQKSCLPMAVFPVTKVLFNLVQLLFRGVRFYARLLGKISQTAQLQIFTPDTTPTQS